MKRVKVFTDFPEALDAVIEVDCEKQVELVIDYGIPQFAGKEIPPDTIRFFATIQPEGHYNDLIRENRRSYNYLLTNFADLLTLPFSHHLISCTAFVPPNPNTDKTFGASTVISGRMGLPGHRLRHELYDRRAEIKIPFFIYGSAWNAFAGQGVIPLAPWPDKQDKKRAMTTMFHVAIDTYDRDDCFSEKLIDPMISMCLPVYWGCQNVSKYFNPLGIFHCPDVTTIIHALNSLTTEDYSQRLTALKENFTTALTYADYGDQLQRKIQEVINANT